MAGLLILFPIGVPELLILFLILLVIFGAAKLPQLGRGLGQGISNFKKGLKEGDSKDRIEDREDTGAPATGEQKG